MREIVFCIDLYLSEPAVVGKRIIIQIVFFAEMLTLEESHSRVYILVSRKTLLFSGKRFLIILLLTSSL